MPCTCDFVSMSNTLPSLVKRILHFQVPDYPGGTHLITYVPKMGEPVGLQRTRKLSVCGSNDLVLVPGGQGPCARTRERPPGGKSGPQMTTSKEMETSVIQQCGPEFCQHLSEQENSFPQGFWEGTDKILAYRSVIRDVVNG
jgi:hypothetical protein